MNRGRRSMRLPVFDYSANGAYFVTICTQDRACLLGECVHGEFSPNGAGRMVESAWNELPARFPHIQIDAFVVMPNHVHGVIMVQSPDRTSESGIRPKPTSHQGDHQDRPYTCPSPRPLGTLPGTLGRVIQAFKSITTVSYVDGVKHHAWQPFPGRLWQRNYFEHIVRDDDELNRIAEYIIGNPGQWDTDEDNPSVGANPAFAGNTPAVRTITRIAPTIHTAAGASPLRANPVFAPHPPPRRGESRIRPESPANCTGESGIRPRPVTKVNT